ncbi:hypothetical protein H2200_002787 [Cladophialophora chaetospira]|uniref:Aquaporin-1 n=1 Tax=Cladophialophora chaetospira TaxID=386627 RepID=A0AA38XJI1_9EURO|nr:hypothetical protein H2200_002787 [Cladophialophora chaetospira]
MSAGSISELPIHYGEVQRDGTVLERSSEELPLQRSREDDIGTLLSSPPKQSVNNTSPSPYHASSGPARHQDSLPLRKSIQDDTRGSNGGIYSHGRTNSRRRMSEVEVGRAILGRGEHRQSMRARISRHDGYEPYSDYDDEEYDEPRYRPPRRVRERAYFPEDEYGSLRRRPGRAVSRHTYQGYPFPQDRHWRSRSFDDYDDVPLRTPRRFYPPKQARGPSTVREDEKEGFEDVVHPMDISPAMNTQIRFKDLSPEERKQIMRLPWIQWMDSSTKNHFVATLGEFIGTTMFLWFAFAGTQVANIPSGNSAGNSTSGGATGFSAIVLLYIAIVFGFSLMVNVWVFFRISGGLFNPAVTLAMWLTSAIPPVRALCLVAAQIAGSIAASALVLVQFPTSLNVRTTLAGGTSLVQGVFIEAVLTAELVFTILMLAKEKHKATFIAPVGIGLALFIAELVGVFYTGGSLNPARSLGPCVVTRTFDTEHWIYWVGPGGGALAAVLFYKFIKMLEYEVANPGQDAEHTREARAAAPVQ